VTVSGETVTVVTAKLVTVRVDYCTHCLQQQQCD
jgi:hypothetical protein